MISMMGLHGCAEPETRSWRVPLGVEYDVPGTPEGRKEQNFNFVEAGLNARPRD
jgi:hypothetical protein